MKEKMIKPYMDCAKAFASLSHALRKKVGGVAITPNDVMLYSWNGTASGDDNECEDKVRMTAQIKALYDNYKERSLKHFTDVYENNFPYEDELGRYSLVTKRETLHAERNIIAKAAKEGISLKDSIFVVTMSPCFECSVQLVQAGVKHVIYEEEYRDLDGIEYLKSHGVTVERVD